MSLKTLYPRAVDGTDLGITNHDHRNKPAESFEKWEVLSKVAAQSTTEPAADNVFDGVMYYKNTSGIPKNIGEQFLHDL